MWPRSPQQIKEPRKDPFMFYTEEDIASYKAKEAEENKRSKVIKYLYKEDILKWHYHREKQT